jgi:uncharacterized protein YkwD
LKIGPGLRKAEMNDSIIYILLGLIIIIIVLLAIFKPRRSYQVILVNEHRKRHRLRPLSAYYPLDRFAAAHSRYLARQKACNHDRFQTRSDRLMKLASTNYVGENCIMYPSPAYNKEVAVRLIEEWMESPEHRANILNPRFSKIGIGVVINDRYVYSTQIFCA